MPFLNFQLIFALVIWDYIVPFSMLFAVLPLPIVCSSINPEIYSHATLPIVNVLSNKHPAVTPLVCTLSMHHIILPVSKKQPIIMPNKQTFAIKHIIAPLTHISVLVWPAILSLALLGRILVEPLILATIIPLLFAEAMLLVLVPVPNILGAIGMLVDAEALCHVVYELSFVEVAACVVKFTSTVIEIFLPKTFVNCAVGPSHDSVSLLYVVGVFENLAGVDSALFTSLINPLVVNVHQVS